MNPSTKIVDKFHFQNTTHSVFVLFWLEYDFRHYRWKETQSFYLQQTIYTEILKFL